MAVNVKLYKFLYFLIDQGIISLLQLNMALDKSKELNIPELNPELAAASRSLAERIQFG